MRLTWIGGQPGFNDGWSCGGDELVSAKKQDYMRFQRIGCRSGERGLTWLPAVSVLASMIAAMLLMFLATGCALTKGHVNLDYAPQTNVSKVEGASAVRVRVEVLDLRAEKDRVGVKKNGYGMEMAPILADNDVPILLKESIEKELRQRSFNLGEGTADVIAELSKFSCDFKLGFWSGDAVAEMTLNVLVKGPAGNLVYSRLVVGEGAKPHIQLASASNAKIALTAALQDAVSKIFSDQQFIDALFAADARPRIAMPAQAK